MYWNHRVVRSEEGELVIAEVYYDGDDLPVGWARAAIIGDDVDSLAEQLHDLTAALAKPVVEADEFIGTTIDVE